MEEPLSREEEISRYIFQRMSPEEKVAFEKRLEIDTDLSREVLGIQKMNRYYRMMKEENDFKKKVAGIHEDVIAQEKSENRISNRGFRFIWYAAASVALLIGSYYFFSLNGTDYQEIAESGVRNFYGNIRPVMDPDARYYFLSGEYQKSLELCKVEISTAQTDSIKAEVLLLQALNEIALSNPNQSLTTIQKENSILYSQLDKCRTDLVKAIALIALERLDESRQILFLIEAEESCPDQREQAKLLRQQIE